MKNFAFICCMTLGLSPLFAEAQTLVKEMDGAHTRFIPGQYMKNGKAAIYFSSDEYGYSDGSTNYQAEIFDFDLKPLKKFNFEILHPYTLTEKRSSSRTTAKTRVITEQRSYLTGIPAVADMDARKTTFIKHVYDANKYLDPTITLELLSAGCRVDGTTIYIALPMTKDAGIYGCRQYLVKVETYIDAADNTGYAYTYTIQIPVFESGWDKITWYDVAVSNFCTPRCSDVSAMNHWNSGVYLPFSQTFFNDDEKFEYVRYKASLAEDRVTDSVIGGISFPDGSKTPEEFLFGITPSDRDGDGNEDYRSTHYGVRYNGLEVVTEDGRTLYSFPIPDNCYGNASIEFFKSDNSILAQADFNWYNDKNEYVHTVRFYRLDRNSSVAKIIRDENRVSVRPNPATRGETVEMTLPACGDGQRTVTVTSQSGMQVFRQPVRPGDDRISIPTEGLASGIYLFTLTENGRAVETCKIIIR